MRKMNYELVTLNSTLQFWDLAWLVKAGYSGSIEFGFSKDFYTRVQKIEKVRHLREVQECQTLTELRSDDILIYSQNHMACATKTSTMAGGGILIVAAMDLGTTYSGYAYSFKYEPTRVITNQTWIAGGRALPSIKTPTCLLLTPEKEFDDFGYEAEDKYASLAEDETHHEWYYFQRFKMLLHNDKNLNRETVLEDINGKRMPALIIFALSIRYLKDHLMKRLQQRLAETELRNISFVLTVPAIWNDKAKQFMREAAVEAGIPSDHLLIALEPEAASIWCQSIKTEIKMDGKSKDLRIAAAGTQYMIVDIGGGTADITVHEKNSCGTLKEIHKASGGPWGGTEVDKSFTQLLSNIVGCEVMEKFRQQQMADYLDVLRDFEIKKRAITNATAGRIVIRIPYSLKRLFDDYGNKDIADVNRDFGNKVEWKGDKIRIDAALIKRCFEQMIKNLIIHVRDILLGSEMKDVRTIMLVGGFAECALVQDSFKSNFNDKRLIVPNECGVVVLKGAVLFGHNPKVVSTRIARYTYGIDEWVPFDPVVHPIDKLIYVNDEEELCSDVFWKAVEIGQPLPLDHINTRTDRPTHDCNDYQDYENFVICKSTNKNPQFVTESDCEIIGEVRMPMYRDKTSSKNTYDQIFEFGGTELKFSQRDNSSGKVIELYLEL